MQILVFLTILILYLPFIIGQPLNDRIITDSNSIPAIASLTSPINIIDDLNTDPSIQDLFYLKNSSQNTNQIATIPRIGATPDILEILSLIDSLSIMIAISHQGKILILYDLIANCYDIYDISNLVSPTLISSISFASLSMTDQTGIISTDGKTAFFTLSNGFSGELVIVDLSNPVYPNIMASYSIPAGAISLAVSLDSKTLFLYSSILTTIDVSDLTSPKNISSFTPPTASPKDMSHMKLHLHDNNLFLKDGDQLYILNISNLEFPEILATINTTKSVDAVISSDGKYAFILSSNGPSHQFSIDIYDISNITSITQENSFPIGACLFGNIYQLLDISPDNNYLYIAGCKSLVIVNVSNVSNPYPIIYDANSIPLIYEVTLSPDGLNAIVVIGEPIILNLHFKPQLALELNVTAQFSAINGSYLLRSSSMAISSDSKTIFMQSPDHLEIINVTDITSPSILSIFNITNPDALCQSIRISPDDTTAYLVCNTSILLLNISNLTLPTLLQAVLPPSPSFQFVISRDGNTGFLLTLTGMQIINLTDLSAPNTISTYNCSTEMTPNLIKISQDAKTAFIFSLIFNDTYSQIDIEIVDISNLSSPKQIYSLYIDDGSDSDDPFSPTFLHIEPDSGATIVSFSLSDYQSNYFTAYQPIPSPQPLSPELIGISPVLIVFSSTTSTAYIVIENGLLVLDISNITSPVILRVFPIEPAASLALSADESTAFLGMENGTLAIIDLTPQYSLYLLKRNFVLGEEFQSNIVPLQLNPLNIFTAIDQDFSIIQVSLYSIELFPLSSQKPFHYTTALPSWIVFDSNQETLTFSPRSPEHIGLYQIYVVISTVIPDDAFIGIGPITNITESLDLYVTLISLGYINTQGYLTSSFNRSNKKLFLTSQYSQYQSQIFNILLQYYIQVITTVTVTSSLTLESVTSASATPISGTSYSKTISISTQSQNSLSVTIALDTNQTSVQSQFVSKDFSVVTIIPPNRTTIAMEGALVDINAALTQIIVNLDDGITSCNGTITVSDGMNLPLTQQITNISDYFILNQPPVPNNNFSIQTQLSQTPIFTGEQFILDMSNMFIDPNNQDLTYSVTMQDSTQQIPEWLTLRGETIIGTPPEKFRQLEINLLVTASNQFKSTSQQFTINIKISLVFALKLLAAYGGALITIIGLYVYLGTIYNILCKSHYRYPKNFEIRVGNKNTVQNICSLSFIKEEVRASKIILDEIMKTIAQEKKGKTTKKTTLVNYFIDPDSRQFDENKLTKMIKVGLSRISGTETKKDKTSPLRFHVRIEVIKQIIVNKLVFQQLDFEGEVFTKQVFNRIKDDWVNLGETSRESNFKLNQHKLEKKLREIGIQSYKPQAESNRPSTDSIFITSGSRIDVRKNEENVQASTQSRNLETRLLLEEDKSKEMSLIDLSEKMLFKEQEMSNINFNLLEKVILAHAFKYHNLNANPLEVEVLPYERTFSTSLYHRLKMIFKRDLYPIKFVKGCEIGYGITYKLHKGVLHFYGAPHEDIQGRTVVIQIMNRRGRILKEIWLDCLAKAGEEEEMSSKQQRSL